MTASAAETFIAKWKGVTASELSTSQSFLIELCELLDVPRPHATAEQDYMFERPLTFAHGDGSTSAGRVDLYRRGCFILESKKYRANTRTRGFDDAMLRAHAQAQNYARAVPASEGRPPFLIVVDVGHRIELFSEFSRSGGSYVPFPDPRSHRIALDDLCKPEIRERLRNLWLDPSSLDPSRESARVTRQIAARLAELAKSLEGSGHAPESVAQFLMRCLFTMFAEDVRLLPPDSFRTLLHTHREKPDTAMRMLAQLWRDMDGGGFSAVLANEVLRFNGKLFKQPDTLPLHTVQIDLLINAARADWKHVEPAIFGTLLERALSTKDRHKLGAHYTPRAYVERLVLPTVIEPLRTEFANAHAAALLLAGEGKEKDAIEELRRFHRRLCNVRVLDPACGSGNFLYVTLEHLKRLEGEVLNALDELGFRQTGLALAGERADAMAGETVDPHNLLGIELNPRAAAIAEVVLWIGYLQWHFRTRGDVNPPVPVIRDFRNIENRDAVLAWDDVAPVIDEHGKPVTRWDGETLKASPITGEAIPDETVRVPLERYLNPRKAAWPQADFVVGNPPFIGASNVRRALGDGYADALRSVWSEVPESADFVMHWWHHAAQLVREGKLQRFGLITTNSIKQTFNRRVIEAALLPSPIGRRAGGEGAVDPASTLPPTAKYALPTETLAFARHLRQQSTDAETRLWMLLRDHRLHGMKFRRQHPLPPYTLDFYCHELALTVELDGSQHLDSVHDAKRDAALREAGITTLRYWNHDLLARTEWVLEDLWNRIDGLLGEKAGSRAPSSGAARHLPPRGEGKEPKPLSHQDAAAFKPLSHQDAAAFKPLSHRERGWGEGAVDLAVDLQQKFSLIYAIPDHPWVDAADGAAVRIAMTVGQAGEHAGRVLLIEQENDSGGDEVAVSFTQCSGAVHADLRIGANVASAKALRANESLSNRGFCLFGAGFIVTPEFAARFEPDAPVKEYRNGRDLADMPRGVKVIDLFGHSAEDVRAKWPRVYQHVLEHVKPERDTNKRESRKKNWWLFGEPNPKLRKQLKGLPRYIATIETAKHRVFQFLDASIAPDNMLIAIASDDAFHLGVLSSRVHVAWALAAGGRLGVGNDPRYNKSRCFEPFPFPDATQAQQEKIRALAEQLDAHRKRALTHPGGRGEKSGLTLTGMYNVLEKLRAGEVLTAKDKTLHEQGLVSILKQLHEELDAAVLDAYGWQDVLCPSPIGGRWRAAPDEGALDLAVDDEKNQIKSPPALAAPSISAPSGQLPPVGEGNSEILLDRLVMLNAERATEEARGVIRWLRPAFQNPQAALPVGAALAEMDAPEEGLIVAKAAPVKALPWPKDAVDQVRAVMDALVASHTAVDADGLAECFSGRGPWKKRLPQVLEMLVVLGRAQEHDGRYLAM